jgi:hypothetical protein
MVITDLYLFRSSDFKFVEISVVQLPGLGPHLAREAVTSPRNLYVTSLPDTVKGKVKQSLYTPWRRLGGEEV